MSDLQNKYDQVTLLQRIIIFVLLFIILIIVLINFMRTGPAILVSILITGLVATFFEIGRINKNNDEE